MKRLISLFTLCVAVSMLTAPAFAADWPLWRGPDGNAISKETGLLKSWPEGGPKLAWEAQLGPGYSSAAIAGGKVFTQFQDADGQYLVAFDEKTGKPLWKASTGKPYTCGTGHNGPRATPTVEGDLVYAHDGAGNLVCVKVADGAVVWQKNILELAGAKNLPWGMAGSPFIVGDQIIMNPGGKGASVMALSKKDGSVAWKAGDEIAGYSTPVCFKGDGVDQYLIFTGKTIDGVAVKDGQKLWSLPWKTSYNVNAPNPIVIGGDKIFVSSGYGTGGALIKPAAGKVETLWSTKKIDVKYGPTPLVLGDYLYGTSEKLFVCLDLKTGEVKWENKDVKGSQITYADGLAYIFSEDGSLFLAKLSPEKCEIVSKVRILPGQQRWCSPIVANGKLFLRDDKKLIALDIAAK